MKHDSKHLAGLGFGIAAGILVVPAACAPGAHKGKQDDRQLTILHIMCDDHSYQTISAYGGSLIETPNIDRIAASGMIFTNSFVANSVSAPIRACLLT